MINLHLDDLAQDYPVPVYSVWIFHTHWCWNLLKGRWDPVGFLLNSESQLMTEASILDDVSVHRWSVIFTPLAYQFHWGNKLIFLELFLEWQTSYITVTFILHLIWQSVVLISHFIIVLWINMSNITQFASFVISPTDSCRVLSMITFFG